MMAFYAAVGRYRIKNENGHKVPYIQKLGKLYPISIPEFVIWSSLLWEVMTYPELEKQYQETVQELNPKCPTFDDMLLKLKERRLIMEGLGYTGMDALFNMLSDAFVVPYWVSLPRKVWTVVRLWLKGQISIMDIFKILKERRFPEAEIEFVGVLAFPRDLCLRGQDIRDSQLRRDCRRSIRRELEVIQIHDFAL